MQFFLDRFRSKENVNKSYGVDVSLSGKRKVLPQSDVSGIFDTLQQYQDERNLCNNYRLTFQVNTICSNALNNSITEIVTNEGSDDVALLNYGENGNVGDKTVDGVFYKSNKLIDWYDKDGRTIKAIRDTQLSKHIVYHCGKDIFNNHILRSLTFKSVCQHDEKDKESHDKFNTIEDFVRGCDGSDIIDDIMYPISANVSGGLKRKRLHLYRFDEIMSYDEALDKKMVKTYNGWYGFYNGSKIDTYKMDGEDVIPMEINRTILSKNPGDFIDMYPGRDLYNFIPKYNKSRKRIEKNWEYCITYPSSSTIDGIDFIGQGINIDGYHRGAVKVLMFDEHTKSDNGLSQIIFYCISKHGLKVGDRVNIYSGDDTVLDNVEVKSVFDSYIFIIGNNNHKISDNWVQLSDVDRTEYRVINNNSILEKIKTKDKFHIVNKRANIDPDTQKISFKKVSDGFECEYYVRIFSRLPNFRFADRRPTENELYDSNSSLLKYYQKNNNDFENHLSKLAFAKNIYSDPIAEIVYTDDIVTEGLRDNLGRPLSKIYLTIVKNNRGYKEWYGIDGTDIDITNEKVEYSHCFGKISSQFSKSEDAMYAGEIGINNLNRSNGRKGGLPISKINDRTQTTNIDADEIIFDEDINFYGDFVCYDGNNFQETIIDDVKFRFNTAQRELFDGEDKYKDKSYDYFKEFSYDEIKSDDYDIEDRFNDKYGLPVSFSVETVKKTKACEKLEGYYYKPHYQITLKTLSPMYEIQPDFITIRTMVVEDNNKCTIHTLQDHNLCLGYKMYLYNVSTSVLYVGRVTEIIDNCKFICIFYKDGMGDNKTVGVGEIPIITATDSKTKINFRLFTTSNIDAPNHIEISRDGNCIIRWRNLLSNGFDDNSNVEVYPFTNGAFYVNNRIDLKLKRQDPFELYGSSITQTPKDPSGNAIPQEKKNNYVNPNEIEC